MSRLPALIIIKEERQRFAVSGEPESRSRVKRNFMLMNQTQMADGVKVCTPNRPRVARIKRLLGGLFLFVLTVLPSPSATILFKGVVANGSADIFTNEVVQWRTASKAKSMDIDGDNIYGSFGAIIWGDGANHGSGGAVIPAGRYFLAGTNSPGSLGWSFVGQSVNPDLGLGVASFSKANYVQINNLAGSALLFPAVSSISSGSGNLTLQFNGSAYDYTNRTLRLGMMMGYQEPTATMDQNKLITVVQTAGAGGGSASTTTLPFTAMPRMYFFDINGVRDGDQVTVTCHASTDGTGAGSLASLGTICLDLSPAGSVVASAPTITSGLTVTPSTPVPSGASLTLSVGASGSVPLTHLWRKGGVVITNTGEVVSATFQSVTTSQSGDYDVVVTNIAGATTSSVVAVTVLMPSDGVTQARYRLGDDDPGAVAGSAGRATTEDVAGGLRLTKTGTPVYGSNVSNGGSNPCMSFNGTSYYQTNGAGVSALTANLDLNNFSMSCDAYFTSFTSGSGPFSMPVSLGNNSGGISILQQNGYWWIYHMGSGSLGYQGPAISSNSWTHVELVRKNYGAGVQTRMFLNGSPVAVLTNNGSFVPPQNFLTIGANQKGATPGDVEGRFSGQIDNVVIANLSAVSVRGISVSPSTTVVQGGTFTFTATAQGNHPLTYLWRHNGTIINNSGTNELAVFSLAQTNQSGTYDLVVTNVFGSATSSPVNVTVVVPGTNITTFGLMLNEMVDRDRMAMYPTGAYISRLVSSTDPRDPGASLTGSPAGYKNVDWSNFRRWERNGGRKEWVLIDVPGPGVLTRWWSGGYPELANCRIYLDNSDTPIFTGNPSLSELVTNQFAGLFGSALAFEAARGIDSYAPIPFQQRLKITWDGSNPHGAGNPDGTPPSPVDDTTGGLWFNIEYRQYTNGTVMQSYTASDPVQNVLELQTANTRLNSPHLTGNVSQSTTNAAALVSGQTLARTLTGPGAIRRLRVNVVGPDQTAALTNIWIELRFDGYRTARVPVGPFFGNGRSSRASDPLNECTGYMYSVAASNELSCLWVMPFETSAEVRLVNRGSQTVTATLQMDAGAWTWDARSMYYHAEFRQEDGIKVEPADRGNNSEGEAMWNFCNLRGRGLLVADTLSVRNNTAGWWGEGDEKIYVDDDTYPSFSGTGTEDYYGYAWGNPALFERRFVAQPISLAQQPGGAAQRVTVQSRLRLLDTVPFTRRLRFDMEVWDTQTGTLDYQAVTHWYGTPGSVALRPVADLGLDFKTGATGQTSLQAGVPDSGGTGHWNYFAGSHANAAAAGAVLTPLTIGPVGNTGHTAYGGGQAMTGVPSANLPAIGRTWIMTGASANVGIQNGPGYHELDLHPGQGAVGSTNQPPFAIARWTCGTNIAKAGWIEGSLRNLAGSGDSVDFAIFHNGIAIYNRTSGSNRLADTAFMLSRIFNAGDTVDFVVGNKGAANALGDETTIRAVISLPDVETNSAAGGGVFIGTTNTFPYATIRNVAITNIDSATLLDRVSSPNGFPLSIVGVSTTNTGASVSFAGGFITYVPPPDFVGVGSFQFVVSDGHGSLAVGSVSVVVGSGDTGPDFNRLQIVSSGQQFLISFQGIPLSNYMLEGTTNLAGGTWIPIKTTTLDENGSIHLQPIDSGDAAMFFRLRML